MLASAGLVMFLAPLPGISLGRMSGLGLISILPVTSLTGAGLLVLAFVLALGLPKQHGMVLGVMLAGIVTCLDGVTAIAEPEPRFATAYQMAGFVGYLARPGHSAPAMGAYSSWPGFFALAASVQALIGGHDPLTVLRWWPTVIDLACLVPLSVILRGLRIGWRTRWFAALLFAMGNWVGQDYFSPQSFNYLLYVCFIAILLTRFGATAPKARSEAGEPAGQAGRLRLARRLARLPGRRAYSQRVPGELPPRPASPGQRAIMLVLLLAIFAFSTVSHPLTPIFLVAACTGLVATRRCTLAGLPVLLAVIMAGWISFAAVGYWSGHMSDIFSGVGRLGGNVSISVAGRMTESTPGHVLVLYARAGFAAIVMGLAAAGLWRRRRRAFDDRAIMVLACVPFSALFVQNYGGEIGLRAYLFALPAACVLASCLFFPATQPHCRPTWFALAAAAAGALAFTAAFFVARYGNEAFEQTAPGELAAMNYLYANDNPGIRLVWLSPAPATDVTPQMPWQYRDIEKVDYVPVHAPRDPANLAWLAATLRTMGPDTYLITTTTQETYLEQASSYPSGWGNRFRAQMATVPGVRIAFADPDAVVYTLRWPPGTPAQPAAPSGGGPPNGTIPTPAALTLLAILLLLLPAQEFLRVRLQVPGLLLLALTLVSLAFLMVFWTPAGLAVLATLLLVLAAREFSRVIVPAAGRLVRPLTLASLPLLVLFAVIVIARFMIMS